MLVEMAVKSMETQRRRQRRWRWLQGHFPVLAGCRNRDFCPLKFVGGGGRARGLLLEKHRPI
jgi:hypothetical protein